MPTFKEFFWRWHRECAIRQYAPKTAERYGELGQYALKHFGDSPLDQLTAEGMTVFLNGLLDHGGQKTKQYPQGRPLAPKTVRHVGFLVQSVLKQAVDWDILIKNVMQRVKKPKVPRRRPRVIDRAGFDVVLRKAQNRRDFARVIVAMATGMRRGELCAVEWTDLNWETGILEVSKSLEETKEGGLRIKGTKADEPRRFTLSKEVLEVLREHKREQDRERELYGATYINRNLIFCRPNGDFLTPSNLTKRISKLICSAGYGGITLHSLRHSHASELLSKRTPITAVSERLGHASAAITLDIYGHMMPQDDEVAAQVWDDAMAETIQKHRKDRWLSQVITGDPKKKIITLKTGT